LDVIVLGGGAAGFFGAVTFAEVHPGGRVTILEKGSRVLAKVGISGGGRCNVTHACFEPKVLASHYPRGGQALLGPFHKFQPRHTIKWFESRGSPLKTEPDGRVFPVTDKSQTIIETLTAAARGLGVEIRTSAAVELVERAGPSRFLVRLKSGDALSGDRLLMATGSNDQGFQWAQALGHTLERPVPSLFTFTLSGGRLDGLAGVSVEKARVSVTGTRLRQTGPVLVTHWGLSGPAVLKLSAWGARVLHGLGYQATIQINWLDRDLPVVQTQLQSFKAAHPRKSIRGSMPYPLPRRLWERLVRFSGISEDKRWADLSHAEAGRLTQELCAGLYEMKGKSAFKEEFVTCGGVRLNEVDFRTMESRLCPGLYFAGEILDIDGVTGGFNLQSAWTTGWLAGRAMAGTTARQRDIVR
jgi:predicted Rossmann fold flavoprotein